MGPQLSGAYTFGALHAPRLGFQVSNTPETTPLIISRGVPLFLPSLSPFSSKRCSNLRSLVLLLSAAVLTVAAPGRPHPAMNTSSFPAPGPQDTLYFPRSLSLWCACAGRSSNAPQRLAGRDILCLLKNIPPASSVSGSLFDCSAAF